MSFNKVNVSVNFITEAPMSEVQTESGLTQKDIRKAYKDLRMALGLTARDACAYLEIDYDTLAKIEHGKVASLTQDKTQLIDAICHECDKEFKTHPLYASSEPVLFPYWVCEDCR